MSQYTSLDHAFQLILWNCKNNAQKRLSKGREEAGMFSIDMKDLKELWISQDGRCHHTGMPLNYDKNEWRVSVDRLDNNKGYIKENICLTSIELNGRKLWTQEKIDEMLSILEQGITENFVSFEKVKRKKYRKVVKSVVDGVAQQNCTICDQICPSEEFTSHQNFCGECIKAHRAEKDKNPRYRLKTLLNASKTSTKIRQAKNNEKCDHSHNIDLEFLIQLYNDQKGLCAISNLPLRLIKPSEGNWAASIERKDPLQGYVKENVCLICCEFNVTDHTANQTTTNSGTSGWTQEKFALLLGYTWLKKGVIASEDELQVFLNMQKQTVNRCPGFIRTRTGIQMYRCDYNYTKAKRVYGQIILLTSPSEKQYVYKTEILDQSQHNIFSKIKKIGHTIMMKEIEEQGEENFTIEILLTCKKELIDMYHEHYIKEYNTIYPNGLNPTGKKYTTKETRQKITNTLVNKPVRHDHNNQVLPKYMKMINWKDRIGYAVNAHPKQKLKYFVSTDQGADMQKLYDECLAYLEQLNMDD
jgi:hypothetical protein